MQFFCRRPAMPQDSVPAISGTRALPHRVGGEARIDPRRPHAPHDQGFALSLLAFLRCLSAGLSARRLSRQRHSAALGQHGAGIRSEEHTSELQSLRHLVCRLLLRSEEHTSELQSLRHLVCRLLLETEDHTSEHSCCCLFNDPSPHYFYSGSLHCALLFFLKDPAPALQSLRPLVCRLLL